MIKDTELNKSLNAVCPYFTMFPLDFPLGILEKASKSDWVFDPFAGRGTTNYAARLLGLPSVGIDSSPIAAALTAAKLVDTSPDDIMAAMREILDEIPSPSQIPQGEFWELAYDEEVLGLLCRIREGLLKDCSTDARKALRAIILGALHGPQAKTTPSYLSNQFPRTFASKPDYSVRYWKKHGLYPKRVDVHAIVRRRAERYFQGQPEGKGYVILADSRDTGVYGKIAHKVKWTITSPPYYGMQTYIPDQWLRNWFLGGPSTVDYSSDGQLKHQSPEAFADEMRIVWRNTRDISSDDAKLVIRFGGISSRKADPLEIINNSLEGSGWKVISVKSVGTASLGRRQADHFTRKKSSPREEYDIWAMAQ